MTSSPRIVCTGPINDYAQEQLARFGDVQFTPDTTVEALRDQLDGTVAIIVRGDAKVPAPVFEQASNLRVVGRTGVGYDNIDIAAATACRIPVVYTPGAGARAVAEAAMSCMLAMSKRLGYWHGRMVAGDWQSRYDTQNDDLDGATLGIVGFGRIGRLVAAMAAPFDMRILAHDPFVTADMLERDDAAPQVELVSLEAIFEKSDYITVHAAMSEENQGLIDRALLSRCKRGAYFVNLARGGILESLDIVCEALVEGRLAGVALDVFEPEPPDFGHPIFARDDCITAPHALAMSHGAMRRIFTSMTNDVVAILEGRPPQFVVNPEVLTA